MTKKLGLEPMIHESARVVNATLGRYTEVAERCRLEEVEMGDYSYIMQDGSIWCATVGKFANIAASVRINATNHPTWRPTLHHFTYRAADPDERAYMDSIATRVSEVYDFRSMALVADDQALTQIKAVDDAWPLTLYALPGTVAVRKVANGDVAGTFQAKLTGPRPGGPRARHPARGRGIRCCR